MTIGSHLAGKRCFTVVTAALLLLSATTLIAETRHVLQGHVPAALVRLQPAAHLPIETNLYLSIGLPLRNQQALSELISELYEPANPKFQQWLTPDQFTQKF
jgi:subtilase family serine protease